MSDIERTLDTAKRAHLLVSWAALAVLVLAIPTGPDFRPGLLQLQAVGEILADDGYAPRCADLAAARIATIWEGARGAQGEAATLLDPGARLGSVARCPTPREGSLEAVADFFTSREEVHFAVSTLPQMRAALRDAPPAEGPVVRAVVTREGLLPPAYGGMVPLEAVVGADTFDIAVNDPAWERIEDGAGFVLWVRRASDVSSAPSPLPVEGVAVVAHAESTPLDWLSATRWGPAAVADTVDGRFVVLQHLQPFWPEVSEFTLGEATRYLQARLDDRSGSIEVLGMTIHAGIVLLGGPLLLLALMSDMLVHLQHLSRISVHDRRSLASYPWLALFPGGLSTLLWTGSIIVLPAAACTALAVRSWGVSALPTVWAGFGAVGCLALGLAIHSLARGVAGGSPTRVSLKSTWAGFKR